MKNSNFNKIAKEVINTEIKGLKKLKKSFDKSFLKALDVISKCNGKVILAGIGKSGLICRKISSTLCSIGISSFYLHPSEASHGDLGMSIGQDKVNSVIQTHADLVTTANPGCIMQIGAGLILAGSTIKVQHPIELLDESYRRAGYYAD